MKEQIPQPAPLSRTLQGKTREANTASVSNVLQAYKKDISQRQEVDEDELLQGKFETAQREELDEDELLQGKFETAQRAELEDDELLQGKFETTQRAELEDEELLQGKFETTQRKEVPNNTGLPDNLKAGVEQLSGLDMSDVKVHYNSSKPANVQAYAYTQGTNIHVAPGQEKHLGHEAWHVAQQKQGRVQPTTTVGGMPVNDNAGLENEADVMGGKAVQMKSVENESWVSANSVISRKIHSSSILQFEMNRSHGITQLMGALLNTGININTGSVDNITDPDESKHTFAVSIGKTAPTETNSFGHSAIMIEGYENSENNHWFKFGEFYPKDASQISLKTCLNEFDGVTNGKTNEDAASEFVSKYVDIDVHKVTGYDNVKDATKFKDGVHPGPKYSLLRYNCSHWVKDRAGLMGISVGTWKGINTHKLKPIPSHLLIDEKKRRRENNFIDGNIDTNYQANGQKLL